MSDLNIGILLAQICLTGMISIFGIFDDSPFIWWSSLATIFLYILGLYSLNTTTNKDAIADITSWIVLFYAIYCGFFATMGFMFHHTLFEIGWWLYYVAATANICVGLYNL